MRSNYCSILALFLIQNISPSFASASYMQMKSFQPFKGKAPALKDPKISAFKLYWILLMWRINPSRLIYP